MRFLAVALLILGLPGASTSAAAASPGVAIRVLSNRPDLVSGGDALVEVALPPGTDASTMRVDVGGRDVTSAFHATPDARSVGLVSGLTLGVTVLTARLGNGPGARITITNHPNGGPVFAGPQVKPWVCQKGAADAQCNQPASYTYLYRSTDTNQDWLAYDLAHPPADVATTTTDRGVTVPFIVRVETGYQDRDQYKIATLYQPGKPWTPWSPQSQWNHKVLITHGSSCGSDFGAKNAPSVTTFKVADFLPATLPEIVSPNSPLYALGAGFAVMSTALDHNGHNCNLLVQAESMVMAKERLVEQYGAIRYTIGTGCSGGSLTQYWVANAYPGIYQGILPTCSFPDTWSSATQVMDYHLLRAYFEDNSKWGSGIQWIEPQIAAVEGHMSSVNARLSDDGFYSAVRPGEGCWPLSAAQRYNAGTNPGGVRCGVADSAINLFGPRPRDVWGASERAAGRGFAGVPLDNVGVQYGLAALRSGLISAAQFLDLNRKIGGVNIDGDVVPQRLRADPVALGNAYRSGAINVTNNLDQTAIIDCRGPDPGAAHDAYRAFAIRARLDREHGGHANQLIWEGPAPIVGDTRCNLTSFIAMDRWLAAVERDTTDKSIVEKLSLDRPADVGDQCWDGIGNKLTDGLCPPGVVPILGTPRTVAGDAITTDTNQCQSKPPSRADYGLLGLTDPQWTEVQQVFATGVCDYARPPAGFHRTVPWLTYQDAGGNVVYGGKPLLAVAGSVSVGPTDARDVLPATGSDWSPWLLVVVLVAVVGAVRRTQRRLERHAGMGSPDA